MRAAISTCAVALALAAGSSAHAQPGQAPAPLPVAEPSAPPAAQPFANRTSWVIGFSLGPADIRNELIESEDDQGIALTLQFGGMVNRRLALLVELASSSEVTDRVVIGSDSRLSQTSIGLAAQYWLARRVWIRGGAGAATLSIEDDYGSAELGKGMAINGAIGYELLHRDSFAADLQLRLSMASFNEESAVDQSRVVGVSIGLTWY